MKKLCSKLCVLCLLVLCIAGLALSAEAVEGNYNGNIHWEVEGGVLTVSGHGEMPDDTYPWVQLRNSIQQIVVSPGITSIGKNVFSNCTAATKVILPESLKFIDKEAFAGCGKLETLVIPANNLWKIEATAFDGCNRISNVYISDLQAWCKIDFGKLGGGNPLSKGAALYLDEQLVTRLKLPKGITLEAGYAFSGCTSLEGVVLPRGLKSIPGNCFSHCPNLRYVVIPASVKHISSGAFSVCDSLELIFYGGSKGQLKKVEVTQWNNSNLLSIPWIMWKQTLGLDFWTVTVNLAVVTACFFLEHRHRKYGYWFTYSF